jgi:hypothetical protein
VLAVPAAVAGDLKALPRFGAALRLRDYGRLDSRGASNNRSGMFAGDASKVSAVRSCDEASLALRKDDFRKSSLL